MQKGTLDQVFNHCFLLIMKLTHMSFFSLFFTLSSIAQVDIEKKTEIGNTNCIIEVKSTKDPVRRSVGSDREVKLVGVEVEINNRKGDTGIYINPLNFEIADKKGNNVSWAFVNINNGLKSFESNIGKRKSTRGWIVFQLPSKIKLKDLILRYNKSRIRNDPKDQSGWMQAR